MVRAIRLAVGFVLAAIALTYAAGALVLWRHPHRFIDFTEPETARTPAMIGIPHVDVWLRVGPRRELVHAWWLPQDGDAPAVLLLHGTGRTNAGMTHVAAAMHATGAAVLMIDFRGLGRSDRGPLTEQTMYEDAEAAWLELRWHQSDAARRFVYGHSLGAAVALELAARYPDVSGVVIEGAPTSLADLLRGARFAGVYPTDWLVAGRFDARAKLPRLAVPILIVHGSRDAIVPEAMALELYTRATGPKSLLLVAGAGHSDAAIVGADEYRAALARLLPPRRERALAWTTSRAGPS